MPDKDFRARDPALAKAEPVVSALSGFDPARMSDPWREMVDEACRDAIEEADEGEWLVNGPRADELGSIAMQIVADTTKLRVIPYGRTDYHEGVKFTPAQGIEAGTDETLQAAQPEGQEPGGVAMRPDTVTPSSQDTDQ